LEASVVQPLGIRQVSGRPTLDGIVRNMTPVDIINNMNRVAEPETVGAIVNSPVQSVAATMPGRWTRRQLIYPMLAIATIPLAARLITHPVHLPSLARASAKPATTAVATPNPKAVADATAASAAAAVAAQSAQLQQLVGQLITTMPAGSSIIVKDLKTGVTAAQNQDQPMTSASLYKLFVATEVYHQIDLGKLSFAQGAGGGTGYNIADCLHVMINISDNACGNALGSLVGWDNVTARAKVQGFTNTNLSIDLFQTSATDVTKLFERLYNGTLLSPDSTKQFLALLQDQRVNNRLPVGLPAGTTIAHKTGDLFGYMHDAGIVYGPKSTYLVTVMGAPGSNPGQFAQISSQIYGFLNK
jgi:beta-lactamase class A